MSRITSADGGSTVAEVVNVDRACVQRVFSEVLILTAGSGAAPARAGLGGTEDLVRAGEERNEVMSRHPGATERFTCHHYRHVSIGWANDFFSPMRLREGEGGW